MTIAPERLRELLAPDDFDPTPPAPALPEWLQREAQARTHHVRRERRAVWLMRLAAIVLVLVSVVVTLQLVALVQR